MDVSDPVGSTFLLPVTLHVQVMKSVSVQLDHLPNISVIHFLVRSTALYHHPNLSAGILEVVVGGREGRLINKTLNTEAAMMLEQISKSYLNVLSHVHSIIVIALEI